MADIGSLIARLTADTSQFRSDISNAVRRAEGSLQSLNAVAARTAALLGGIGLAIGLSELYQSAIAVERFISQLKTATGSIEAANAQFKILQDFAKTTPFTLDQAVEGFLKLKNLGLDPTIETMTSFGNTSSAMVKSLMQFVEAVADAATGEFERLKEFGIRASKQGDQVQFTFQNVTTTVKNSSLEIQKYLRDIGDVNFAGAMEDQMQGLIGAVAAAKGAIQDLFNLINASGVTDVLEFGFLRIAEAINLVIKGIERVKKLYQEAKDIFFGRDTSAATGLSQEIKDLQSLLSDRTGRLQLLSGEDKEEAIKGIQEIGLEIVKLQNELNKLSATSPLEITGTTPGGGPSAEDLEKLRLQYVAGAAAAEKYKETIAGLDILRANNAISEAEYASSVQKAKEALDAATGAAKQASSGVKSSTDGIRTALDALTQAQDIQAAAYRESIALIFQDNEARLQAQRILEASIPLQQTLAAVQEELSAAAKDGLISLDQWTDLSKQANDAALAYAGSLEALHRQLDPVYDAQQTMNAAIRGARTLLENGRISLEKYAEIVRNAADAFVEFREGQEEAVEGWADLWKENSEAISSALTDMFVKIADGNLEAISSFGNLSIAVGKLIASAKDLPDLFSGISNADLGKNVTAIGQGVAGIAAASQQQSIGGQIVGGALAGAQAGFALSGGNIFGAAAGAAIGAVVSPILGAAFENGADEFSIQFLNASKEAGRTMFDDFSANAIRTPFGLFGSTQFKDVDVGGLQQFNQFIKEVDQSIATLLSPQQIRDVTAALENWQSASTRMVEGGFDAADALQLVKERFEVITGAALPQFLELFEQIGNNPTELERVLVNLTTFDAAMRAFGLTAVESKLLLDDLQRGTEDLTVTMARLYNFMFTEEERRAKTLQDVTRQIEKFNTDFGVSISSIDDLRAFARTLDLTTQDGRDAAAAVLRLADAMALLDDAATEAAGGLVSAAQTALANIRSLLLQAAAFFQQTQDIINSAAGASNASALRQRLAAGAGAFGQLAGAGFTTQEQLSYLQGLVGQLTQYQAAAAQEIQAWLTQATQALQAAAQERIAALNEEKSAIQEAAQERIAALNEELALAQEWAGVLSNVQSVLTSLTQGPASPLGAGALFRQGENIIASLQAQLASAADADRAGIATQLIAALQNQLQLGAGIGIQRGDSVYAALFNSVVNGLQDVEAQAETEAQRAERIQGEIAALNEEQAARLASIDAEIAGVNEHVASQTAQLQRIADDKLAALNAEVAQAAAWAQRQGMALYAQLIEEQKQAAILAQGDREIQSAQLYQLRRLADAIESVLPAGSYQSGGVVPRTGNYTLHAGETVVPAGKSAGGQTVVFSPVINISGAGPVAQKTRADIQKMILDMVPVIKQKLKFG